jgi:hypothetical protein
MDHRGTEAQRRKKRSAEGAILFLLSSAHLGVLGV